MSEANHCHPVFPQIPRVFLYLTFLWITLVHALGYMPQSYNFAGQVLLFPVDRVTPLDISSSELMTTIVSGGVSGRS